MPSVPDDVRDDFENTPVGRISRIATFLPYACINRMLALPADSRLALSRALCPDTHAVVPREPTEPMLDKGRVSTTLQFMNSAISGRINKWAASDCYRAMIAASEQA